MNRGRAAVGSGASPRRRGSEPNGRGGDPSYPHGHSALSRASCGLAVGRSQSSSKELSPRWSGVRERPMIIPKPTTDRPQQRYDHAGFGISSNAPGMRPSPQTCHAFTGDVKVLELEAPDHAVVGGFDERGQDAKCCPGEHETAPKPSQGESVRRPSSRPKPLWLCGLDGGR
jgi:hypothetical protein